MRLAKLSISQGRPFTATSKVNILLLADFAIRASDYVADEQVSDNRIVPDAAFIIENIETNKRSLFFLEMDMTTERIVTHILRDKHTWFLRSRRSSSSMSPQS